MKLVRKIARVIRRMITGRNGDGGQRSFPPDFSVDDIAIIKRVQPYTYSTPERTAALCNAVRYVATNNIPGAIVECGVWRGGSSMAAMLVLLSQNNVSRDFYLYDTYEGQSRPTVEDVNIQGVSALEKWANITNAGEKMTYASLDDVKEAVRQIGYPSERIHYVVGKVEDTIPNVAPKEIALLRLDTDWYASTRHELEHLYPRLSTGGVIIIDDYGHWAGARKAVDEFIEKNGIKLLLNRIDYTLRAGVKVCV